jgi:hypothetical protein
MSSFEVLTGAEFNALMAKTGTKLCKVLNHDLIHYNYKYVPGILNILHRFRHKFNPDPNCKPGGLYFCAESEILRWIDLVDRPLIAYIRIPDNAQISIGEHKFKTDMLILGEPITLEAFCSTDAVKNLSIDFINDPGWDYRCEWRTVKKVYELVPDKFDPKRKAKLLYSAIRNSDAGFLDALVQKGDVQKMLEDPQIKERLAELLSGYNIEWFASHYPRHADLIHKLCNLDLDLDLDLDQPSPDPT